jgi:hypothetical protein
MVEAVAHAMPDDVTAVKSKVHRMLEMSYKLVSSGIIFINASYNYAPNGPVKCRQLVLMAAVIREIITTKPN